MTEEGASKLQAALEASRERTAAVTPLPYTEAFQALPRLNLWRGCHHGQRRGTRLAAAQPCRRRSS